LRRRWFPLFASAGLALTVAAFGLSATASAATWTESHITGLSGSLRKGEGVWLELPWTILWELGPIVPGAPLDPRAVERLANGNTLVTSRDSRGVYEVTPQKTITWSYTTADDPLLVPFHATRLPSGNTLIVDRWQETVIEVDPSGNVVWRYGVPDDPNTQWEDDTELPDPGELIDPFHVVRLPNGNTLIAENQACTVIEVRSSDYVAGLPNDGYTADSIVWQYGVTHELAKDHGYAVPYLDWPKYAVRLANGNTLIADEAASAVLEVTPAGAIAWSYGQRGVAGSGPGQLNEPASAERLADGTTLISDGKNNRSIRVNAAGEIVWEFSATSPLGLEDAGLSGPRRTSPTGTGSVLIADEGNDRLIELGRAPTGLATSGPIDCGLPGARKRFQSINVTVDAPSGTAYAVSYSVDSGQWKTLGGSALPSSTYGKLIRYRVTFTTTRADASPRLLGVSISYVPAPAQQPSSGGSGTGSGGRYPWGGGTLWGSGSGSGTGGSKQGGTGYYGTSSAVPGTGIDGATSVQRGWSLTSTTYGGDASSRPSSAPAPALGGLLALGVVYVVGACSVPLGTIVSHIAQR